MKKNRLLESEVLDFKRELPKGENLAKLVIAFANGKGGQIVIGYDQKFDEVFEIYDLQNEEEKVANIICDYCEPRPHYFISYDTIRGMKNLN